MAIAVAMDGDGHRHDAIHHKMRATRTVHPSMVMDALALAEKSDHGNEYLVSLPAPRRHCPLRHAER